MTGDATILASSDGERWVLAGDVYTIKASSSDTDGSYTLLHAYVPPGGGPGTHRHEYEDEAFYVLDGVVTFTIEGDQREAHPGAYAHIPRGVEHAFRNNTDNPARMLILVTPGGFDGFVRAAGRRVAEGEQPDMTVTREDISRLLEAAPNFGVVMIDENAEG